MPERAELDLRGSFLPVTTPFDPVITAHYDLEQWEDAFASLRSKENLKAMFLPNGADWAS